MSEKTYQITESALQALLKEQKGICAKSYLENFKNYGLLNAPTPDLSHLKEAPQLPDLKEEIVEAVYQELNEGKYGLTASDAHKLTLCFRKVIEGIKEEGAAKK